LRDQPPSDSEVHVASAFSHMLPGPPPNLGQAEIARHHSSVGAPKINFPAVHSFGIRRSVTNDSIARYRGAANLRRFSADSFCRPGKYPPGMVSVGTDCPARAGTANCDIHVHVRTSESPMNPIRVWCEIRLQTADVDLSFDAGSPRSLTGIGVMGTREGLRLMVRTPTVQFGSGKGTKTHVEQPLADSSYRAQTTSVLAGR
jgi:hypothetical protein